MTLPIPTLDKGKTICTYYGDFLNSLIYLKVVSHYLFNTHLISNSAPAEKDSFAVVEDFTSYLYEDNKVVEV